MSLFVVCLLFLLAPAFAQRGGGHASSGGRGGFSGHGSFGGHAGGVRSFAGTRSASGFAGRGPAFRQTLSSRGFSRSNGVRIRTYGFRNNCYGYACRSGYGYPWGYAGLYNPYWWWDSGSSYDADRQQAIGLANEMNQQSLEEQQMRNQQDQDLYARSAPPPPHQEERTEAAPATVLVFRDQRTQEVQNYAIVGQTLWSFAPQHTQKIPLSDLDLAATAKINDARGVDFRVPGVPEGQ
jgi:hypothetical protein